MQELKIFENAEFGTVRALEIDGAPWFVGKDVADILGYSNTRDALAKHVDGEDKSDVAIRDAIGRDQSTTVINESGLYSLVLSSKLPAAKAFKRWVTSEVLPTIRRHGLYAIDDIIADPDLGIRALLALKAEREARKALEVENKVKDQQIAELKPKASYYDLILQCSGLLSVTEIAKDYGLSAKALNKMLHDLGVQFNQSGVWFLYSKYQSYGYTQTKTQNYNRPGGTQGARTHMYWTQKGRLFLYDLLKRRGVLPMIERTEAA
nr:MAG TPA: repressor domain protein [Caudoviricetes sp.]